MQTINLDKASRKLTQLLRHQVIDYNLNILSNGFVKLNDILKLNLKELKNITINDINVIINTNEKKRLETTLINNELYIRATQGHNNIVGSMIIDNDALEKITLLDNINFVHHGTQKNFLDSILTNGLNRMNRKHIHFVENINKEKQTSGFKNISDVIITIDLHKCLEDGIEFYKSKNNVILTEGIDGIISSKYICNITHL